MPRVEVKISEREEKARLLAKAINLMLMEGEELPEGEIRSRIENWFEGRKDEKEG